MAASVDQVVLAALAAVPPAPATLRSAALVVPAATEASVQPAGRVALVAPPLLTFQPQEVQVAPEAAAEPAPLEATAPLALREATAESAPPEATAPPDLREATAAEVACWAMAATVARVVAAAMVAMAARAGTAALVAPAVT